MSYDELPIPFTPKIASVLASLDAGKRPSGILCFPPDIPNKDFRTVHNDTPVDWLRRVMEGTKHRDQLAVFANIALVIEFSWETSAVYGQVVKEVHCQAVVTPDMDIEDVMLGKTPDNQQYFRVDYEPWNLGNFVFPDPLPHTHARVKREPRFSLSLSSSLPHVDFLEFLLRNYQRPQWQKWANTVWDKRVYPTLPVHMRQVNSGNTREAILAAFSCNQFEELTVQLKEPVLAWKAALKNEKKRMCTVSSNPASEIISY